jgi:hypothetical protein
MAITPNSEEGPDKSDTPGNSGSKKKAKRKSPAKKAVGTQGLQAHAGSAGPTMMAGARTGLLAFVSSVLGIAVLAGALYATAPFWYDELKPYLPAALKDPFDDPRIVAVAKRAGSIEQLKKAQASDTEAIQKLGEHRTKIFQQLDVLMKRLDEQDQSLKSMRKMIQATVPPSDAVDTNNSLSRLSDKLSYLGTNKQALEKMLGRIAKLEKDEKEIARITKRLKKLETSGPRALDVVTGASAAVLAVNQLRDALRRPTPFTKELNMAKRLSEDHQDMLKAIAVLEPLSLKGVPTLAILRTQFQQTAQAVVKAANKGTEKTWVDRVMNRLKGLVTIRRTGEEDASTPDALMVRTEESLEIGDLNGALELLGKLSGKPADAAKAWVRQGQSRVDAERALATLHVQAVALLAPQKKPPKDVSK